MVQLHRDRAKIPADVVVIGNGSPSFIAGFREHKEGGAGSLLLGLYDDDGTLHHIGVVANLGKTRGAGIVRVESGWVAFEYNGRESFIPTGAMCATRPRFGPGTPYYEDAPDALAQALTILDFSTTDDVRRPVALEAVLSAARPRDAVTEISCPHPCRPRAASPISYAAAGRA